MAGAVALVRRPACLVERRGESLEVGLARLAAAAPAALAEHDPAAELADTLGADSEDDVAVVVVRPAG